MQGGTAVPGDPHSHAPPSTAPQDRAALGCKAYTTRQARRPSLAAQPTECPRRGMESSLLGSLSSPATVAHVLTTAPLPQRAPTTYVEPSCHMLSSCSRWGVNKTDGQRSVRLRLCGALHTGHSRTYPALGAPPYREAERGQEAPTAAGRAQRPPENTQCHTWGQPDKGHPGLGLPALWDARAPPSLT